MKKTILILSCLLGTAHAASKVISLDDVLKMALERSERIQAIDVTLQSLSAEMKARDLVLSPTLTSELAVFKDERETSSPTSNRGGTSGLMDVTLEKPFATGTKLSATISHDTLGAGVRNSSGDINVADWNFRISQSLLRDGFGRGTELRKQAETAEERARRVALLYEKQQYLVQIEQMYWDLVYSLKEQAIRKKNLERSAALERWARSRVQQFAAEEADLLQTQALVSSRKLDLTAASNDIEVARNSIRTIFPDVPLSNWTLDLKSLEGDRNLRELVVDLDASTSTEKIIRMDALAASYLGEQLKSEASQIDDVLKPRLDVYASYGANGINSRFVRSWDRAAQAKNPAMRVGVLFSLDMDTSLKNEQRSAATLAAMAQEIRAKGLTRESEVAWDELVRNIENLKAQVKEARELATLQNEKVNRERVRYEQGRTTTLQMTTFEVDAAESELRLYQLLVNLRKAESMARVFIRDGEAVL